VTVEPSPEGLTLPISLDFTPPTAGRGRRASSPPSLKWDDGPFDPFGIAALDVSTMTHDLALLSVSGGLCATPGEWSAILCTRVSQDANPNSVLRRQRTTVDGDRTVGHRSVLCGGACSCPICVLGGVLPLLDVEAYLPRASW